MRYEENACDTIPSTMLMILFVSQWAVTCSNMVMQYFMNRLNVVKVTNKGRHRDHNCWSRTQAYLGSCQTFMEELSMKIVHGF